MKLRQPFYALYKEFNTGHVEVYDVLKPIYYDIFNDDNSINKEKLIIYGKHFEKLPVKTWTDLKQFLIYNLKYLYAYKCEWEFIVSDWPTGKDGRPYKIDVYQQLEPNIDVITDIVWEQIKDNL